ncbi:acyltransferase [Arthrobacter sp. JCM 19049]|uniref:acyltransferase family protein n=1 Tax=Arthrobacter sp. JCM 19049 TaxID=1460643 RepID=UPI0024363CE6|nr:acyltransferase [Arthrobacter sp. JCM 19049]
MSSNSVPAKNFRPEIQALRALAVLLVVAYHLEPGLLPGGYIGVDIFFVISGFLITGHLLREAQRTATVNLPAFFAARARRILPAALVVIAAVVGGSLLLLPRTQWQELGIQRSPPRSRCRTGCWRPTRSTTWPPTRRRGRCSILVAGR